MWNFSKVEHVLKLDMPPKKTQRQRLSAKRTLRLLRREQRTHPRRRRNPGQEQAVEVESQDEELAEEPQDVNYHDYWGPDRRVVYQNAADAGMKVKKLVEHMKYPW